MKIYFFVIFFCLSPFLCVQGNSALTFDEKILKAFEIYKKTSDYDSAMVQSNLANDLSTDFAKGDWKNLNDKTLRIENFFSHLKSDEKQKKFFNDLKVLRETPIPVQVSQGGAPVCKDKTPMGDTISNFEKIQKALKGEEKLPVCPLSASNVSGQFGEDFIKKAPTKIPEEFGKIVTVEDEYRKYEKIKKDRGEQDAKKFVEKASPDLKQAVVLEEYFDKYDLKNEATKITQEVVEDYLAQEKNEERKKFLKTSLKEKATYMSLLGLGVMGLLFVMPDSFSGWNGIKSATPSSWVDHVTHRPVFDKDDWTINYIGHPISGAAYYLLARNSGQSWQKSFLFSAMMSTFFWEYGIEAFPEKPSIQDLFCTPIIGSIMGEIFYRLEKKILDNNGRLFGSRKLGTVALWMIDPVGNLIRVLMNQNEKIKNSKKFSVNVQYFFTNSELPSHFMPNASSIRENRFGIGIRIRF